MLEDRAVDLDHVRRQPLVGIDEHGAVHWFDQYRDTVWVLSSDGALKHVEELDPGQLPEWVDYVRDKRGWSDCRYTDRGPFAALVDQLAKSLEPTP